MPEDLATRVKVAAARIGAAGRAAWPEVAVDDDHIAARLTERVRDDSEARLDELHDADLYLAIALADGDKAALRVFEDKLVPQIDVALRRMRLAGGTADEVKQVLRFELLVPKDDGSPDARPKIAAIPTPWPKTRLRKR